MILWVIQCQCGHRTLIPDSTLQEIGRDRVGLSTDDAFLDFVCHQCACGTRYLIRTPDQCDTQAPSRYSISLAHPGYPFGDFGHTASARTPRPNCGNHRLSPSRISKLVKRASPRSGRMTRDVV